MQQALVYADMMDVPFVYSTNGDALTSRNLLSLADTSAPKI